MLDLRILTHWYAVARANMNTNKRQQGSIVDVKMLGGWYGALKAAIFIAGLVLILGAAVWFFLLICKIMVLGLALIGDCMQEFTRLYNQQLPLVQLLLLTILCSLVLRLLGRGWRVVVRPAFQPIPLGRFHYTNTTNAYCPPFRGRYKGAAYDKWN